MNLMTADEEAKLMFEPVEDLEKEIMDDLQTDSSLMNLMTIGRLVNEAGSEIRWNCRDGLSPLETNNIISLISMVEPTKVQFKNCNIDQKLKYFRKAVADMQKENATKYAGMITKMNSYINTLNQQKIANANLAKKVVG